MRDFRNAKDMAKTLRAVLAERSVRITHSESLELVARILGSKNWQTLAAAIEAAKPTTGGVERPSDKSSAVFDSGRPPLAAPVIREAAGQPRMTFTMAVLPVRDIVVLPGMVVPLFVGRAKSVRAIERAMEGDGQMFLTAQRRREEEAPTGADLHEVGVIVTILRLLKLPDSTIKVLVQAGRRARVRELKDGEMLEAQVETFETPQLDAATEALAQETLERYWRFAKVDPGAPPAALAGLEALVTQPGALADELGPLVAKRPDQMQALLEEAEPAKRLKALIALMGREREAA